MPTNFCRIVSSHICFWAQALIADSGAKHHPRWKTTAVHPLVLKGSKFHQWERKFHQIETSCVMSMTLSVGFCLRSDSLLWAQTTQNAFRRHQHNVKCPLKDNHHPLKSRSDAAQVYTQSSCTATLSKGLGIRSDCECLPKVLTIPVQNIHLLRAYQL